MYSVWVLCLCGFNYYWLTGTTEWCYQKSFSNFLLRLLFYLYKKFILLFVQLKNFMNNFVIKVNNIFSHHFFLGWLARAESWSYETVLLEKVLTFFRIKRPVSCVTWPKFLILVFSVRLHPVLVHLYLKIVVNKLKRITNMG